MLKKVLSILLVLLLVVPIGSVFADNGVASVSTPQIESPTPVPADSPTPTPSPGASPIPTPGASPGVNPEESPEGVQSAASMTGGESRRYIVQYAESPAAKGYLRSESTAEAEQIGPTDKHMYVMELDQTGYQELLNDSRVLSIQPDNISCALGVPNDPNYSAQWNLAKVNMPDAWEIEDGSADVVVAVIDTGAAAHPDLTNAIVSPYDVINEKTSFPNYANDGDAPASHGTFVAGIIAAIANNGQGIAGMAPGVSIMPINVFEWDDSRDDYIAWDSSLIEAIYHAIENGADVINMSLGGANSNPLVLQAISDARAAGIVVVAAAGNSGNELPIYPASYDGVISVSATDQNDQKASFASFGGTVDLSAPGVDIRSLNLSGYAIGNGTSYSAPMVSALAALLKSRDASLTPDQVEYIMESTAVDLGSPGFDHTYGEGRIDAYAALSYLDLHPSVRLIASAPSPQAALSPILLTADIENSEQYEFYFEGKRGDGDWTMLRDWDADNTYSWLPAVYGSYNLRVSVRPIGGSVVSQAALFFTITAPPWVSRGDDAAAVSVGEPIHAELTEVGEQDMYRFTAPQSGTYIIGTTGNTDTFGALFDGDGTLITENDNDTDSNFRIVSEMTAGSVYYIGVRHAGAGTGPYTLSVERQAIPVESVTLQTDAGTSAEYKSEVRLSAQITGGDEENALYRFEVKKAGGKWQVIRDFAPENECVWVPAAIGTYDIRVFARNNVQVQDATDQITFTARDIAKQTKVTLALETESEEYNHPIALTATAEGEAAARAEYRYAYYFSSKWYVIQEWTDSPTCEWTPPKKGTYTFRVYTRTKGRTNSYDTYADVKKAFSDIPKQTSVTLTPDKLPAQEAGTTIKLTARATEGNTALSNRALYQFQAKLGSKWTIIQDWGTDPTCDWTPDKMGTYTLRVYAKTEGRSSYDTYKDYAYKVEIEPLESISVTIGKTAPQEIHTDIPIVASTVGRHADGTEEYQLRVKLGNKWTVVSPWSTTRDFTWRPTKPGKYTVEVQARAAGCSGHDVIYTETYKIIDIPKQTGVTLTADKAPVQEGYNEIKLTALNTTADATLAGRAEYKFTYKLGSKETVIQDWSKDATCTWIPQAKGKYTLYVYTRTEGRSGNDKSATIKNYGIDITPLTDVSVTTDRLSPQPINAAITLTATAEGLHADNAEYLFRVKDGSKWRTLQNWSTSNTCTWTPKNQYMSTVEVQARVKGRSGTDVTDKIENYFIYTGKLPVAGLNVTIPPECASPQEIKQNIEIHAQATGEKADGTELYLIRVKKGSKWTNLSNWSTNREATWQPAKTGTYTIEVQARAADRKGYDAIYTNTYKIIDIPKQTGVSLLADKDPIQEARTEITLTAVNTTEPATLAGRAEYKFTYKLGSKETVIQDWSKDAACTWIPQAKGKYTLYVYTRTEGRSGNDKSASIKNYEIDITPLTGVSITTDKPSPQPANTAITLTATAEGLHADNAEYLFRVKDGSKWRTLQNWSTSNTCAWTPKSEYMSTVEVQARAKGRSGTDVTEKIENYFIYTGKLPVAGLNVTIPPECASPQEIKQNIEIHSQATGESADGTEEYQLRVKLGSKWTVLSKWSTAKDFTWQPSKPGTYTIEVQARAAGRKGYDAIHTETFTAIDIPKQEGVTLASSMTEPQEFSIPITLTATPVGDEALTARAEYRFQYKLGTKWTEIRGWDKSNTVENWTPTKAGTYTVRVEIKTEGRSSRDAYADITCKILDIPKQAGVNLTVDPEPIQEPGTTIKLTAETTTADPVVAARAEYQFQVKKGSTWTILKDWHDENPWEEPDNTWRWTPETAGTYYLRAYVRTNGRLDYDKYKEMKYVVDIIPLSGLTVVGDPVGPVEPETKITITATAEGVHADQAEYRFSFYNGSQWFVKGWSDTNVFTEKPSHNATYKFKVEARVKGRSGVDKSLTLTYRVGGYVKYTYSASDMAQIQYQSGGAVKSQDGKWVKASKSDILYYVNPQNWLDGASKYQFLSLNYISGISASDLNAILSDNPQNGGVLNGKGKVFLDAGKQYNINPAYLVSHAMLETGNGTSELAKGIYVTSVDGNPVPGKTAYNMYGIGAVDSAPNKKGSEKAYKEGWFSHNDAIKGGAKWISENYINRASGAQNTLYAMRWNPNYIQGQYNAGKSTSQINPSHQYATDIAWAVKQVDRLKRIMDRCVGAVLEFIIPDYK